LLLCVGAALLWWERPLGQKGVMLAVVCGASLSIGILMKILNVTACVPILMLIVWRIRNFLQEPSPKVSQILMPVVFGFSAALAVALIAVILFLSSLGPLLDQVVSFHLVANKVSRTGNLELLTWFFTTNGFLTMAAVLGTILALLRHDWRVVPLLAWLVTT